MLNQSYSLWAHELQHAGLAYPSLSPGVCSNSCPLSRRWHPTISSSATPFSFCSHSFPSSGSFPVSRLFTSVATSVYWRFSICPSNDYLGLISCRASLVVQLLKNPPAMQETWVRSLGWEDPLEKGKASHSSFLTYRILWPMELQRVGHDWATFTFTFPVRLTGLISLQSKGLSRVFSSTTKVQKYSFLVLNFLYGRTFISA